jgi:hypothetical protein
MDALFGLVCIAALAFLPFAILAYILYGNHKT